MISKLAHDEASFHQVKKKKTSVKTLEYVSNFSMFTFTHKNVVSIFLAHFIEVWFRFTGLAYYKYFEMHNLVYTVCSVLLLVSKTTSFSEFLSYICVIYIKLIKFGV